MTVLFNNNLAISENQKLPNGGKPINTANTSGVSSFQDLFKEKIAENTPVQFSKHANMRLLSRNINLSTEQMQRVEDGVQKAKAKGIKDSLVLVDNVALVVNVTSKIVITAINNNENENVFTNIDGAVIV